MKISQAYRQIDEVLSRFSYPPDEKRAIARTIVGELLLLDRTHLLLLDKDTPLTAPQQSEFKRILSRLAQGMPLQYIIGYGNFGDFDFELNPSVLIPRPETEELCALITQRERLTAEPLQILDIGTGSGCIAITLAATLPQATLCAFDLSEEALATAAHNAHRLVGSDRIHFFHANVFDPSSLVTHLPPRLDIIVSNPPYIHPSEAADMTPYVLNHEPHMALFAPEEDPLAFYRTISILATEYLTPNGRLYLEVNATLAHETKQLVSDTLEDADTELLLDLFGRPRFVCAVKQRTPHEPPFRS